MDDQKDKFLDLVAKAQEVLNNALDEVDIETEAVYTAKFIVSEWLDHIGTFEG